MTGALEPQVETLEAPAPALLPPVGESNAIRVLFIDKDAPGLLTDELCRQGFTVLTAVSLADAQDAARHVDVIVLNCDLANISSIDLLGKLCGLGLGIPVVLLTGEAAPSHECLALDNGAIDVIFSSRGPDVLARRLKGVAKSFGLADRPKGGRLMECGKLLLSPDISRACWESVDVGLTLGEYNIVYLLASNAGRYVTYRAIYDRLHYEGFIGGSGPDGYRGNVRSAIKRTRNKFRAYDLAFDEIENYAGFGYCWKRPA